MRSVRMLSRSSGLLVTRRLATFRGFHSSLRLLVSDPYSTLGVGRESSSSEIKKLYYKLAKQYHPDINKEEDAQKKFHDIQDAYEILSNPEKKQQFDQFGTTFDQAQAGGAGGGDPFGGFGGHPFQGGENPFANINFEDIFGGAFGQRSNRRGLSYVQTYEGNDVELLKTISFKEAIFGTSTKVDYSVLDQCNNCHGSGLKEGRKKSTCSTCQGTGSTVHFLQAGFQMASTCKSCEGTGVTIDPKDECSTCHGHGTHNTSKETEIKLPSGIKDGSRLRVAGEGDSPNITTGPNVRLVKGDLIIRVRVKPDPNFTRDGNDLIFKSEIPMTTAALGGQVTIPTLDGDSLRLKVPTGTQSGRVVTVPDKGVPINGNNNRRGNLKVQFQVKIMRAENPTQQLLLEALAHTYNDKLANVDPSWKPFDGASQDVKNDIKSDSKLKKVEDFFKGLFK